MVRLTEKLQMDLHTRFPENKGSYEYGSKYLVVEDKNKGADHKYKLLCRDCEKEIFASPSKIFAGQKPCACGKNYYSTPERKQEKIEEVSKIKNIYRTGDEPLVKSTTKFEVECGKCFYRWSVYFTYFVTTPRGCPDCARQRRYTDNEYIEKIQDVGRIKKFKFISKKDDNKLRSNSYVILMCDNCEDTWESLITNILSYKYGCPNCSKSGFNLNKKSVLYLLKISKNEETLAYKYGITNNLDKRLENIRSSNKELEIDFVCSWGYPDGKECRAAESRIKELFSHYLSKDQMRDGYTETICPEDVMEVFLLQQHLYTRDGRCPSGWCGYRCSKIRR